MEGNDKARVSSGVSGLDDLLNGGFVKGSVNALVGGAGSGKTTASLQFLLEGAARNEKGIYICRENVKKTVGLFLKKFPKLSGFLSGKKILLAELVHDSDIAADMRFILGQHSPERIAMDPAVLAHEKAGFAKLYHVLKRAGCTSLVTVERTHASRNSAHPMEGVADCAIALSAERRSSSLSRSIRVKKMRGSAHDESVRQYVITEKGLGVC